MKKRILIVEDEKKLSQVMSLYLEKEGYSVTTAKDGLQGEYILNEYNFDLIILDVMMPNIDGWSLLRKIKSNNNTPVILTTARGEEEDRIFGLELGADDYMVKPISMRELVLRVNLRIKSTLTDDNKEIILENIIIDENKREVIENTHIITLTPKEFDLLVFFCKNPNQVFNRSHLLDKVWGYDFSGDTRTVDTHVKNLREKLSFCSLHLKTIWGVGYKLEVNL
ncbi:response regulator transcription factor [Clostridium sp. MB40-C1]|uniref:response regulator transcription factor n=1 Tax=Clostridium sp. MB40-C1 TaxID=3070996 RepID=UPI0027E055ED|nr:response regulator transcription factor [Clostridium sp. MB40-C1]WMJ79958.1 response regulator transcription factor [Clostridium sp. MB40-C1]